MHLCLVARDSGRLQEIADTLVRTANIGIQVTPADSRDRHASG